MLGRKNYTQEELEHARTAVGQQLMVTGLSRAFFAEIECKFG